jgi:hypothetical protein
LLIGGGFLKYAIFLMGVDFPKMRFAGLFAFRLCFPVSFVGGFFAAFFTWFDLRGVQLSGLFVGVLCFGF